MHVDPGPGPGPSGSPVAEAPPPSGTYRLPGEVQPVGVFRRRYRSVVRSAVRTRSLRSLRTQRHRSGWPWVVSALSAGAGPDGMLLDDFVERTFNPNEWGTRVQSRAERRRGEPSAPLTWDQPWVGIFHLPPDVPTWFQDGGHPREIFASPRFQQSLPHLRGAVALSEHLATWLRAELGVPVIAVKHPTDQSVRRFDWDAFAGNPDKALVQIGWYLRNYRAIYQVPVGGGFRKVHLSQDQWFVKDAERRTDRLSPHRGRPDVGAVDVVHWLPARQYDDIFHENLVFLELFDASANNVVVEAIVRGTPIVVNRHPALVEYLGDDYPLFYGDLGDVPGLLQLDRIRAAHEHLCAMDTTDLTADHFVRAVTRFVTTVA